MSQKNDSIRMNNEFEFSPPDFSILGHLTPYSWCAVPVARWVLHVWNRNWTLILYTVILYSWNLETCKWRPSDPLSKVIKYFDKNCQLLVPGIIWSFIVNNNQVGSLKINFNSIPNVAFPSFNVDLIVIKWVALLT